jgi:hypothetical protein
MGSNESTPEPDSITLSNSDDDEPTNKAKSQRSSKIPSMSRHKYELETAKRIAINTKLLMELTGPVEGTQDVDQEPREHGEEPVQLELADE